MSRATKVWGNAAHPATSCSQRRDWTAVPFLQLFWIRPKARSESQRSTWLVCFALLDTSQMAELRAECVGFRTPLLHSHIGHLAIYHAARLESASGVRIPGHAVQTSRPSSLLPAPHLPPSLIATFSPRARTRVDTECHPRGLDAKVVSESPLNTSDHNRSPGPLTLRMMLRVWSSMNSTRTWVTLEACQHFLPPCSIRCLDSPATGTTVHQVSHASPPASRG